MIREQQAPDRCLYIVFAKSSFKASWLFIIKNSVTSTKNIY